MKSGEIDIGKIREYLSRNTGNIKNTDIVLGIIALGAVVAVLYISPALLAAAHVFAPNKQITKKQSKAAFDTLRRRGYIHVTHTKVGTTAYLSRRGIKRARDIVIDTIAIPRPKRWDGKWRVVVFDVPKEKARVRNDFRWKLQDLGFYKFQNSVWVYPYLCEAEINDVIEFFTLWKHVGIFEVTKISGEKKLRSHFKL